MSLIAKQALATSHGFGLSICGDNFCDAGGKKLEAEFTTSHGFTERMSATNSDVADGNWHHFTMVADKAADKIRLFVDGAEMAITTENTGSWPTITNTDALQIGRFADITSSTFLGPIDDVRIYNYALTPTQIRTVYNEGSAIRFGPLTGSP